MNRISLVSFPAILFPLLFILLTFLFLPGCSTVPTEFHATERHCKYDRVGVEYSLECSSKGTVELSDGLNMLEVIR